MEREKKSLGGALVGRQGENVLAVEQHRGNPGAEPVRDGYVTEQAVIDAATKAGFKFVAKSEINANPKDTKDHPFGVWTLPPTRQSSENGKPVDPSFDRAKYDAIGESDRMTLRFEKPHIERSYAMAFGTRSASSSPGASNTIPV